jgi:hypothetical protein
MKSMNRVYLRSFVLFLGGVIASCIFTAGVNAQASFVGKVSLPYEVHWGHAVLPAGDYSIRMESTNGTAKISSASRNMAVYTNLPTIADNDGGGTYLTITTQGKERRVRFLNLPELGKLVIFAPLTKSEREYFAKSGQITTVPVIMAKK